jgi:DNA-binding MarR family transcriptional regulator
MSDLSPEGMRAWRAFLEAHAAVTRTLEDELRDERDLPLTWYDVLVQLDEAGGTLRMHELADRLLLSRSATTRFAERLERAGLVERRRSGEDRRGTDLVLTDEGRKTLEEAAPVHLRGVQEHFGRWFDPEEAETLAALLSRLVGRRSP